MLHLYNTLTRKKEHFKPRQEGQVHMFVCGPTVYDYIHIGNARTFVFFDVVAKYLRTLGYNLNYIQNITDIDDKIITRAQAEGVPPQTLADRFTEIFYEDTKQLGIDSVSTYASATKFIPDIIKQVKTLIDKGHAYKIEGDGWYFDLSTFPEYGKLSGRTAEMAEDAVSRVDQSNEKRNKGDFCLWKFPPADKSASGPSEPLWLAEIGEGRPGWHIEDTAITEHYFGQQYDLHGGAQDLIFPHHEAEIAQQEAASGKAPFVQYWMHAGFLKINDKKMSKSLGNFMLARDLLKDYAPQAIRMMFLSSYYRSPLNYTDESIKQFGAGVARINEFIKKINKIEASTDKYEVGHDIKETWQKILDAMNDDFNTPLAIGALFDFIRKINPLLVQNQVSKIEAKKIKKFFEEINGILGIIPLDHKDNIPASISNLVELREEARQNRDWAKADIFRDEISKAGYKVEDTPNGPYVSMIKRG